MSTDSAPTRVLLVDDHEIVRRGIAQLLDAEPDIEVVGEAGSLAGALPAVVSSRPEVAVLDVRLGDGSGLEACRQIRGQHPEVACLILTSYADDRLALEAAEAGAAAFVIKQVRGSDLVDAIRKVSAGAVLLDDAEIRVRTERYRATERGALEALTEQERKVFDLIGEGKTNKEIGATIYLAEKTIKNYVSSILAKLGLSRRSELAAMAARIEEQGRIDGPEA
jgi:DNA-binding NarL/FixJ family response regulator